MRLRALVLSILLTTCLVPVASAATGGRVGGVVVAQGSPQLGAVVMIVPEVRPGAPLRLITDGHGVFSSRVLQPGVYSVRVRLAGFLPAFEPRVHITTGRVTLLRIELGSVFSSVEELRRGPRSGQDPDEWSWVLRSATLTRPVLRFSNGRVAGNDDVRSARRAHGDAEMTAGSLSPWSPADPDPLGTMAFLYNQGFEGTSHMLLAGRIGYEHAAATANIAASWIPEVDSDGDPAQATTVVFRQSQLGEGGTWLHGAEIEHTERMRLGDAVELEYGAQFVVAMLNGTASSARPEARLRVNVHSGWIASLLVASSPHDAVADGQAGQLDSFSTPLEGNGRLVLDRAWHEEVGLDHALSPAATISAAVFRDSNANTAIFGHGNIADANTENDPYSDAFVYDGGALHQWGVRMGYKRKLSDHWRASLLYGWSRGLAVDSGNPDLLLRDRLEGRRSHSAGGRISGRIERWGTEVSGGYQWVSRPLVTRPDIFGATAYGIDPYLNFSIRQPLPGFLCSRRIVAVVDVQNLLAQGYVSLETGDGHAILIPAARAFRGGFTVQF